ncbi:phosphopantetheine--protein transferase domain-containing protein [Thalassolituus maritimus]|uniref:Phosphopantetheine--protein transferase domain-containing protein n=1 Tax=Thalassolituus maritimus TaxID=484498 RepID=A0A1N7Q909_9GAMM|nr:4'-phosphopantetheinyl transferase superfamily protein [Thalassolituus maritimus]SIT19296.1 phosphopantetheine--protein transferase domain-containing protein [Thalassolituus maritimus]
MQNIYILYHHYDTDDDFSARYSHYLNAEQKKRAAEYRVAKARMCHVSSRALLNAAFRQFLSCDVNQLELEWVRNQKPHIVTPGYDHWQFNVSHANGLSAMILTENLQVGIDVESIDRKAQPLEIAKSFFHLGEYVMLQQCETTQAQQHYFFKIWTFKEAYLKALGVGLAKSLKSFQIDIHQNHFDFKSEQVSEYDFLYCDQWMFAKDVMCTYVVLSNEALPFRVFVYSYDIAKNSFCLQSDSTEIHKLDLA